MISFNNDYSEGACKEILEALIDTNFKQTSGYGMDEHCAHAAELIKKTIGKPNADVHFVPGGTPCNVLAIVTCLKPYEAVICVEAGHINVHETGAVEATGHKILTVKGKDGKILPEEIESIVLAHPDEHMVKPKMVFISNATECGTTYSKTELMAISSMCQRYGLYLYMDGARLSNALVSKGNDLTLNDIAEYTDMFYIGGTKNGALFGEAMVILNSDLKPCFRYTLKQHCSMMAKGRLLGVQFETLFTNELYLKNARHANKMAAALKYIFNSYNIPFLVETYTNQIFPILTYDMIAKLSDKYIFQKWCDIDETSCAVRFVCSWATREESIMEFYRDFRNIMKEASEAKAA